MKIDNLQFDRGTRSIIPISTRGNDTTSSHPPSILSRMRLRELNLCNPHSNNALQIFMFQFQGKQDRWESHSPGKIPHLEDFPVLNVEERSPSGKASSF